MDDKLTELVIGAAFKAHNQLGFGFLESVYEKVLSIELEKIGIPYSLQSSIRVLYSWVSPFAVARRAIKQAGGVAHHTYTSRFVFQNSQLQPADVMGLIPYLKNVPIAEDIDKTLSKCIDLDFTATRRIDEKTVLELVKQLKNTILF